MINIATLIDTNTTYNNSTGSWKRGLSSYQIWLTQGNTGSVQVFLDSLKAVSPTFSEPVVDEESGTTSFTITDVNGEHNIVLNNGMGELRSELLGDAQSDTSSSKTIEGLIKKTDQLSDTLSTLESYVGTIPTDSSANTIIEYINSEIEKLKQYID